MPLSLRKFLKQLYLLNIHIASHNYVVANVQILCLCMASFCKSFCHCGHLVDSWGVDSTQLKSNWQNRMIVVISHCLAIPNNIE